VEAAATRVSARTRRAGRRAGRARVRTRGSAPALRATAGRRTTTGRRARRRHRPAGTRRDRPAHGRAAQSCGTGPTICRRRLLLLRAPRRRCRRATTPTRRPVRLTPTAALTCLRRVPSPLRTRTEATAGS
ncbi:hypothetical protein EC988_009998, partial [Linderina pennispora]